MMASTPSSRQQRDVAGSSTVQTYTSWPWRVLALHRLGVPAQDRDVEPDGVDAPGQRAVAEAQRHGVAR